MQPSSADRGKSFSAPRGIFIAVLRAGTGSRLKGKQARERSLWAKSSHRELSLRFGLNSNLKQSAPQPISNHVSRFG